MPNTKTVKKQIPSRYNPVLLLLTLLYFALPSLVQAEFKRVDYYVWTRHEALWPYSDNRFLRELDIVIYFHATLNGDGSISYTQEALDHLEQKLKTTIRPDAEIWIGVVSLAPLINNPTKVQNFNNSVTQLTEQYGFKGLDIDWEEIVAISDYKQVISNISSGLRQNGFRISTSHGAPGNYYMSTTAATKDMVDWCNLQFYYGYQNAYSVAEVASILAQYEGKGVPRQGMAIGLPVYAAQAPGSTEGHPEVGWDYVYNRGADPNANQFTTEEGYTYYYSGIPLLKEKVKLAYNGYRGVFTWEFTTDLDDYGHKYSLLRTIDSQMAAFDPGKDSDGDGMTDFWEVSHNLDRFQSSDASLDLDGDGMSNLAECNAATDPQDFQSKVMLEFNAETTALMWFGKEGRDYQMLESSTLNDDWKMLGLPVSGSSQNESIPIDTESADKKFYVIDIIPDPINRLYNGGWEDPGPNEWSANRNNWGPIRTGNYAFQAEEAGYQQYLMPYQEISVNPGQVVTMKSYGYFSSWRPFSSGDVVFYEMRFFDASGNRIEAGYIADWWGSSETPQDSWVEHTFNHIAPDGAVKVQCYFALHWDGIPGPKGATQIFCDDASITITDD